MSDEKFKLVRADQASSLHQNKKHPQAPPITSVVYYFFDPLAAEIKIGTTYDYHGRLQHYREGNRRLELGAVEDGGTALKAQRHREFKAYHITKDWFRQVDEILDHMMNIARRNAGTRRAIIQTEGAAETVQARAFLEAFLQDSEHGVRSLLEIKQAADSVGLPWRAIERAKTSLNIKSIRTMTFPATVMGWQLERPKDE